MKPRSTSESVWYPVLQEKYYPVPCELTEAWWRHMATKMWFNIGRGNSLLLNAITWTNVDLSSVGFRIIHMREIWQDILRNSVHNMRCTSTLLKSL